MILMDSQSLFSGGKRKWQNGGKNREDFNERRVEPKNLGIDGKQLDELISRILTISNEK